ncbi:hypothetical protein MPTK1_1g25230 [Marchantia polymorpha subsp. ruderalis]|uniref:Uncharacterized protein n=2 Tax=Marchantia polymorpha TaxID=3197 RepID=A0AAF6AU46_MARPO|nr:hypothetical protein MARPO_0061s0002 [Marchantia polymorpha]BBM99966.1 hypothetical protein Mp_1g25230 [Marchantia polymorpha subsp. ruderalis]|eukprot:PTQ36720.1 hypothetical protein MARPO_0061s0002 [Marchantia polymorpha]
MIASLESTTAGPHRKIGSSRRCCSESELVLTSAPLHSKKCQQIIVDEIHHETSSSEASYAASAVLLTSSASSKFPQANFVLYCRGLLSASSTSRSRPGDVVSHRPMTDRGTSRAANADLNVDLARRS